MQKSVYQKQRDYSRQQIKDAFELVEKRVNDALKLVDPTFSKKVFHSIDVNDFLDNLGKAKARADRFVSRIGDKVK